MFCGTYLTVWGDIMIGELRRRIELYLNGHETQGSLETWLVSNLQSILDSDDQQVIEAANQIDADLVELGEGIIDEVVFIENLESLLRQLETISIAPGDEQVSISNDSATTAETVTTEADLSAAVVNLPLDLRFASPAACR